MSVDQFNERRKELSDGSLLTLSKIPQEFEMPDMIESFRLMLSASGVDKVFAPSYSLNQIEAESLFEAIKTTAHFEQMSAAINTGRKSVEEVLSI